MRKSGLILCLFLAAPFSGELRAEVIHLSVFPPSPVFTEEAAGFSGLQSWGAVDHGLNQASAPENAHGFDVGSFFTFVSTRTFSFSGLMRERFQFRAVPGRAFTFWGRALVTDLRLSLDWKLKPFILGAGYRHDCKHDFGKTGRIAIHDVLFSRLLVADQPLPYEVASVVPSFSLNLGAEWNLPLLFQQGAREPDRGQVSFEGEVFPLGRRRCPVSPFFDGSLAIILRSGGGEVVGTHTWNLDARGSAGAEFRAGHGGIRLFWFIDRTTDTWAEANVRTETLQAVELLIFSSW